jgi:segregation and condensation protein B
MPAIIRLLRRLGGRASQLVESEFMDGPVFPDVPEDSVDGLAEALRGAVRPQAELPTFPVEGATLGSGGPSGPGGPVGTDGQDGSDGEDEWGGDDLETAYRKALEAMEQAWETAATVLPEPVVETQHRLANAEPGVLGGAGQGAAGPGGDTVVPGSPVAVPAAPQVGSESAGGPGLGLAGDGVPMQALTPVRVLEAILFVGGQPLALTKLARLIGESTEPSQISSWVESLNAQYAEENRPYEIRYSSGGYHLELRPEYEKLRQRVYGVGPREVKLSQEVLEVLALVAYQQPVTVEAIEGHGKQNAASILRQLLRRDLIAIERAEGMAAAPASQPVDADDEEDSETATGDESQDAVTEPVATKPARKKAAEAKVVAYRTTDRFLQLFSLRSLADLPRPDDVETK